MNDQQHTHYLNYVIKRSRIKLIRKRVKEIKKKRISAATICPLPEVKTEISCFYQLRVGFPLLETS